MVKNNNTTDSVTDNATTNPSSCTRGKSGDQMMFSEISDLFSKFIFSLVQQMFCVTSLLEDSSK